MRYLLLALGVVVLGVAVWAFLSRETALATPAGQNSVVVDPELPSMGSAADRDGSEESTGAARVAVSDVPSSGVPSYRVRVTLKETGAPVPGATVDFVAQEELEDVPRKELELASEDGVASLVRRYGQSTPSDEAGLVSVFGPGSILVMCRHQGLFGQLGILADSAVDTGHVYELELERDVSFSILVVDSLGEAAEGVTVELVPEYGVEQELSRQARLGVSTADGRVSVWHAQQRLSSWERGDPAPVSYTIRPRIPGYTERGVPFDPSEVSNGEFRLQLPPTGRVVVRTLDHRGAALLGERGARAGVTLRTPSTEGSRQWWPPASQQDGLSMFEYVVTDREYSVSGSFGEQTAEETVFGPSREGQEVSVDLSFEEEAYYITGQVLDESGEPVRGLMTLSYQIFYDRGSRGGGSSFPAADDGRFRVVLPVDAERGTASVTVTIVPVVPPSRGDVPEPTPRRYLRDNLPLVPGDNDLGEVTLELQEVFAAGRVLVDGDVPGRERVDPRSRARARGRDQVSLQLEGLGRDQDQNSWGADLGLELKYLDDGRFEIRGTPRLGRHRLKMRDGDYLPIDPIEVAAGDEDLLVEVEGGGSLQASVVLSEGVSGRMLRLKLERVDGDTRPLNPALRRGLASPPLISEGLRGDLVEEEDGRARFFWSPLWPGTYRLDVRRQGTEQPLVTLAGIEVKSGDQNDDPRLADIDLRSTLRAIRVRVSDSDGNPIGDRDLRPVVAIQDPGAKQLKGFTVREGMATIVTAEPAVDLLVLVRGFQREELFGVGADTEVTLKPHPTITFSFAGGMPQLPAGYFLNVYASSQDSAPRGGRTVSYDTGMGSLANWDRVGPPIRDDAAGQIGVRVGGAGTYNLTVRLRSTSKTASAVVLGISPAEIKVTDAVGQAFEIQIPAEGLAQALKELKR